MFVKKKYDRRIEYPWILLVRKEKQKKKRKSQIQTKQNPFPPISRYDNSHANATAFRLEKKQKQTNF